MNQLPKIKEQDFTPIQRLVVTKKIRSKILLWIISGGKMPDFVDIIK